MPVVTKQLREAPFYRYRIIAVGERNADGRLHCPALEFFREAQTQHPDDLEKLSALLDFTAEEHPPKNEQKFKHLTGTDGIYEFKAGSLRLLCFWDSDYLIVCSSGTVKKSKKTPPGVIKTAEKWKTAYFTAKARNLLHHEPEHL
ncbi:MAG: type II toxin-antitoxin system RelE/ParE family toxin [Chthoniobacteraceae bacterium]